MPASATWPAQGSVAGGAGDAVGDAALLRRIRGMLELADDATELEVLAAVDELRTEALAFGYRAALPELRESRELLARIYGELTFEWSFSDAIAEGRATEGERDAWRCAWREDPQAALEGLGREWLTPC